MAKATKSKSKPGKGAPPGFEPTPPKLKASKEPQKPRMLDSYLDPLQPLDPDWDYLTEVEAQRQRVLDIAVMAAHAAQVPRRLNDATPVELRNDKRINKQIRNRMMTCYSLWCEASIPAQAVEEARFERLGDDPEAHPTDPVLRTAIQIDWFAWWQDHKVHLQNEARRLANQVMHVMDRKSANKVVHKLNREWEQLSDILDDPAS